MTETRKILYSPGYGAGWSTWNGGAHDFVMWLLTYQPIIDFIEGGGEFPKEACEYNPTSPHPLLERLKREALDKFGEGSVCCLGAHTLRVATVEGRFRVDEYDGNECIETESAAEWF